MQKKQTNENDHNCDCDYCSSSKDLYISLSNLANRKIGQDFNEATSKSKNCKIQTKNEQNSISRNRSKSSSSIDDCIGLEINKKHQQIDYNADHEILDKAMKHHLCSYYHNLWQSELFKSKAFEKQNEKLEQRVKCLENKLEKETLQQIKISLEWRKTVINLVDENTRLKILLASSSNSKSLKS